MSDTSGWAYRPDIDGLRAVSILLVVAFHAGWQRFAGGFVGVDVFFVLSGYLITGLLLAEAGRDGRVSLVQFYARRARRLLPLACLTIVTTLVVAYFLVPPLRRADLVADARAGSLYVANWRFARQATAYSEVEVSEGLFVHLWSLSIEEQYYLAWPALVAGIVYLGRRRGARSVAPAVLALAALVVIASFAVSVVESRDGARAYYLTHARVWEIGVGAVLAVLVPLLPALHRWFAEVLAVVGVVMIVTAALVFDATTVFPGHLAAVPVVGTALVIVSGARRRTAVTRALALRPAVYVGQRSYAWYLWHWPAIGLALLWHERNGSPWNSHVVTAGAVVASFGLAELSSRLVETPVRHARWLATSRARSLGLGAVLTTLPVLLGVMLVRLDSASDTVVAAPGAEDRPIRAMTPAEADIDGTALVPYECHVDYEERIAVPGCEYGDPGGAVTVALIGDSHAQHWLPALDEAGRDLGWRVLSWTKSSCTVIDVPLRSDRLERDYDECDSWRASLLEELRRYGGIDLIVVADSYNYAGMVTVAGALTEDPQVLLAAWRAGTERTVAAYSSVADRIVLLRDTPWARRNVPDCLSEHPSDPAECAFALEGRARLDEEFTRVELEAGGDSVVELDLTDAVCEVDPCPVVTPEGVIKYRDRQHLTGTFSESLAATLGDALASLL